VTVKDEESGAESSYWILGEGDHDYGADVISYRAPLGRALTGRREGDVVEYASADGVKKLKITSVKAEIPSGPPNGGKSMA
jgi:transcription elongation factor GreA